MAYKYITPYGGTNTGITPNVSSGVSNYKYIKPYVAPTVSQPTQLVQPQVEEKKTLLQKAKDTIKGLDFKKIGSSLVAGAKALPSQVKQATGVILDNYASQQKLQQQMFAPLNKYLPENKLGIGIGLPGTISPKATETIEEKGTQLREAGAKEYEKVVTEYAEKQEPSTGVQKFLEGMAFNAPQIAGSWGLALGTAIITKNPALATTIGLSTSYGLGASEVYTDARMARDENGNPLVNDRQATNLASFWGMVIGALDMIPLERLIRKTGAVEPIKKSLIKKITAGAVDAFVQSGWEGVTESAQEVIGNAVQQTYQENVDLMEGVTEAGLMGFIFGALGDVSTTAILGIKGHNAGLSDVDKEVTEKISNALGTEPEKRTPEQQEIVSIVGNKVLTPDEVMEYVVTNNVGESKLGKKLLSLVAEAKANNQDIQLIASEDEQNLEMSLVEKGKEVAPAKKPTAETITEPSKAEKVSEKALGREKVTEVVAKDMKRGVSNDVPYIIGNPKISPESQYGLNVGDTITKIGVPGKSGKETTSHRVDTLTTPITYEGVVSKVGLPGKQLSFKYTENGKVYHFLYTIGTKDYIFAVNPNKLTSRQYKAVFEKVTKKVSKKAQKPKTFNYGGKEIPIVAKTTDELLKIIKEDTGGFRTPEQVAELKADIKENGIKFPLEIIEKADGSLIVNDGKHRIRIAKELGIKELPTIMVKSEKKKVKKQPTQASKGVGAKPKRAKKSTRQKFRTIADYVDSKGVKFRTPGSTALIIQKPTRELTSRFLEHQDIKGKETLSYTFIENLAKSTSIPLKQTEREVIQNVLETQFKGQKKINMADFKRAVLGDLLPLDIIRSDTYATYGIENLGYYDSDNLNSAKTYILNSTFEHGQVGHFPSDFEITLPKEELEIKEIPANLQQERGVPNPRDKYAVVRKGVELTEENIEENVFNVTSTMEEAQNWIDSHTKEGIPTYAGTEEGQRERPYQKLVAVRKKGLFGHFRTFDNTEEAETQKSNISNVAEIQSDTYQHDVERLGILGQKREAERSILDREERLKNSQEMIENSTRRIEQLKNLQKLVKNGTIGKKITEYVEIFDNSVESEKKRKELVENNDLNEEDVFRMERYFDVLTKKFNSDDAERFIQDRIYAITGDTKNLREDIKEMENRLKIQREGLEKMTAEPTKEEKLFLSYKNIWQERIVREAINIKALEGVKYLRFPTARTSAIVEGFVSNGQGDEDNLMPYEIISGDENRLEPGDQIDYGGDTYTVVDSDESNITVAPEDKVTDFDANEAMEEDITSRWEDAKYQFEELEKDFGEIDTAEKANTVIDRAEILQRLALYNNRAKDIKQEKENFKNSESHTSDLADLEAQAHHLANYENFKKVLENDVIKKEKMNREKLGDLEFKDKLEKKYGLDYGYWNYLMDLFHQRGENGNYIGTPASVKKGGLAIANENISRIKERMDRTQASIVTQEEERDRKIEEIKNREKPTPLELRVVLSYQQALFPNTKLEEVGKENHYYYGLDYEVEKILGMMGEADVDETFTIDDFEDKWKENMVEGYEADFEGMYSEVYYEDTGRGQHVWAVTEGNSESFNQPDEYEQVTSPEEFDIEKFEGDQKTVLLFYEKQVIPYLQKLRKDAKKIEDDYGNEWWETELTEADKEPPTAYRVKTDLAKVGIKITDEQEQEIIRLNKQMFGDTNVKVTSQIFANKKAVGAYQKQMIKILDGVADPEGTLFHEAVHKYLDIFTTRQEHIEILTEAQKRYNIDDPALLEEKVAEDFIKYAKSKKGVFGKLKIMFDEVLLRIRSLFKNESKIDELYVDIISGKARRKAQKEHTFTVPRGQLPVGTGKEFASTLEARVKGVLDSLSPEIIEQLGLTTYKQMNKAENIRSAIKFVRNNRADSIRILKGEMEAPPGILRNSIYVALENIAKRDVDLALKLASIQATRLGQEISILTEVDRESPVRAMRDIINIREKTYQKRFGKKPIKEVREKIVGEIRQKIKAPDKYDWNNFLNSIECK